MAFRQHVPKVPHWEDVAARVWNLGPPGWRPGSGDEWGLFWENSHLWARLSVMETF